MKIGVIMGGISSERDVSILTGNEIVKNLNKQKYEVIPLIINNEKDLLEKIQQFEFAFIALHGKFGEDGRIQSILEAMGIKYSGCGVLSSALCMDKNLTKKLFVYENIPTPEWRIVNDKLNPKEIERFCYPLVVKPNSGGSSIATSIVRDHESLKKAVDDALVHDSEVMIEKYIKGNEITCSILNGEVLPTILINPKDQFFNYNSKYNDCGAEETIINLPDDLNKRIIEIANKCWFCFKLKVYARIDMIIKGDEIYVLEINTLPGMTKNSLLPKSAKAFGLEFDQLLDKIIEYSLDR